MIRLFKRPLQRFHSPAVILKRRKHAVLDILDRARSPEAMAGEQAPPAAVAAAGAGWDPFTVPVMTAQLHLLLSPANPDLLDAPGYCRGVIVPHIK